MSYDGTSEPRHERRPVRACAARSNRLANSVRSVRLATSSARSSIWWTLRSARPSMTRLPARRASRRCLRTYPPRELIGEWPRRGRFGRQDIRAWFGDWLDAAQWRKVQTATLYGTMFTEDRQPRLDEPCVARPSRCAHSQRNVLTAALIDRPRRSGTCPWTAMTWSLPIRRFPGESTETALSMTCGRSKHATSSVVKYMIDSLRPNGRCGVIVPEGVLFGSTGAHKEVRRMLPQNNRVEAVLSRPGGVFRPIQA